MSTGENLTNGFTLIETLFVLLVVSVMALSSAPYSHHASLNVFMQSLQTKLEELQLQAFCSKEKIEASIDADGLYTEQEHMDFPRGIACQAWNGSFTEKGNISRAGTIHCTDGIHQQKLVIELGMGRMIIREE